MIGRFPCKFPDAIGIFRSVKAGVVAAANKPAPILQNA